MPREFCRIADDVVLGRDVQIHAFVNLYGCSIGDGTRLGTFVNPASANSSTSCGTVADVAFIACAISMVARFQTNSPVCWILLTVSFQAVLENPISGG